MRIFHRTLSRSVKKDPELEPAPESAPAPETAPALDSPMACAPSGYRPLTQTHPASLAPRPAVACFVRLLKSSKVAILPFFLGLLLLSTAALSLRLYTEQVQLHAALLAERQERWDTANNAFDRIAKLEHDLTELSAALRRVAPVWEQAELAEKAAAEERRCAQEAAAAQYRSQLQRRCGGEYTPARRLRDFTSMEFRISLPRDERDAERLRRGGVVGGYLRARERMVRVVNVLADSLLRAVTGLNFGTGLGRGLRVAVGPGPGPDSMHMPSAAASTRTRARTT